MIPLRSAIGSRVFSLAAAAKVCQPEPSLASSSIAAARLSMPDFFLLALSPFSPIQKKLLAMSRARTARSLRFAMSASCLRNASKLGSL